MNVEYLGRIGYKGGVLRQGILVNTELYLQEIKKKKIILLGGASESGIYAEMLLKEKGIEVYGYADNSERVCKCSGLRGKVIGTPYQFFGEDEYYFIICVYDIAVARLQLMTHNIRSYSIFLNHPMHDFCDEDYELQKALLESINDICFKDEEMNSALPYISSTSSDKNKVGNINFLLYSTTWSHWTYLWAKDLIEKKGYTEVLEIGPGYGLMSLVLLKLFQKVHINWYLLGERGMSLEKSDSPFEAELRKVKRMYEGRLQEQYGVLEKDELSEKKYDLIILTEVFEHFVLNPVNTMKKLADALSEDGRIVLSTPAWGHLPIHQSWEDLPESREISEERYFELLQCEHIYQYSKEELNVIFGRAGLAVEKYSLSDSDNHNFALVRL